MYVKRRARRRKKTVVTGAQFAFGSEQQQQPDPDEDGQMSEHSVEMYNNDDDSGAGDDTSSSRPTSSSPSSSSSTKTDSAVTSVQGSDGAPDENADVVVPEPAVDAQEVPGLHLGGRNDWKGFKFGPVYPPESANQNGWEVTCCHTPHKKNGRCRRTYRFAEHGGPLVVEKLLKHWCLTAHLWPDRLSHRDAPDPDVGSLRSLAAMDATVWPPESGSD